jgi:hypothetical protein
MDLKNEWKKLAAMLAAFVLFFWLPLASERFVGALMESLYLAKWYAREHVILCLVPAFFIAGAIGVFISQQSVMRYLGARAHKVLAYGVASVSGSVLAVCSCTVLPLFAGIWRMGAGLGPATAFLYSGPAINVLAIVLTARILGWQLGLARATGAVVFAVVIGLLMHLIYRKEEAEKAAEQADTPEPEVKRPLWQNAVFFAAMVAVLVFANWGRPNDFRFTLQDGTTRRAAVLSGPEDPAMKHGEYRLKALEGPEKGEELVVAASEIESKTALPGPWTWLWRHKWMLTAAFAVALGAVLVAWFGVSWWRLVLAALPAAALALVVPDRGLWVLLPFSAGIVGLSAVLNSEGGESEEWLDATWGFAKQIMPLLFFGVLIAGFLLGRPGHAGIIPARYVQMLVGESPERMLEITGWGGGAFESVARAVWPVWANLFAAVFGAFMYFATLTEVPILQGLIGAGMGPGPALALLLAGPALSLPNMLVIRSIMGTQKTLVFCSLVVVMATISGMIYGVIV